MAQRLVEDCRSVDDGREFHWALSLTTFHWMRFISFGVLRSVLLVMVFFGDSTTNSVLAFVAIVVAMIAEEAERGASCRRSGRLRDGRVRCRVRCDAGSALFSADRSVAARWRGRRAANLDGVARRTMGDRQPQRPDRELASLKDPEVGRRAPVRRSQRLKLPSPRVGDPHRVHVSRPPGSVDTHVDVRRHVRAGTEWRS